MRSTSASTPGGYARNIWLTARLCCQKWIRRNGRFSVEAGIESNATHPPSRKRFASARFLVAARLYDLRYLYRQDAVKCYTHFRLTYLGLCVCGQIIAMSRDGGG